jgi:murein L,D-transpeptidase YcbB/YkuD
VNLADQHAFVLEDGRTVFRTRVVIGTRTNKTPMFIDTLTNIVLNPAWNVPPSIEAKEILPKLRRDPQYLVRNHMVRVNGGIQQLPGPWNSLGQIAFMFPNRFNVYMHDTPAKELFASPDRAHSHGCIRVERPHELAALLLEREGVTRARLDSVIATGTRTVVWLRTPVPVRITYATAFVSDDGALQFRRDVYGRDGLLQTVLDRERRRAVPRAVEP